MSLGENDELGFPIRFPGKGSNRIRYAKILEKVAHPA
jgi:hypothetical protein